MRLGGPIFEHCHDGPSWAAALSRAGYRAAYCPLKADADDAAVQAWAAAARDAGIVIAEVGAWSNPMSPDPAARAKARDYCKGQLALAERIGARCCVNISGSLGEKWAGPHPANLTSATFELVVEMVRDIIDAVRPRRTFFCLETMPWMYPDSPQSYLELLRAIDRSQFAVHLDPVNLVCSPQRYFDNAGLIRECFAILGPWIRSCHAKDVLLDAEKMPVHLDEVRPGLGKLDYHTFLLEINKLDPETPLMLEHLPDAKEYELAATYVRSIAADLHLQM